MNAIYTQAHNLGRKPTKREIYTEVLDAIEHGIQDPERFLSMLYAHYMPAPPKNPSSLFDWVALAADPKESCKPAYRYIHVFEGGTAYATDGHRMHTASCGFEPGIYDVARHRVDCPYTITEDAFQRVLRKDPGEWFDLEQLTAFHSEFIKGLIMQFPHDGPKINRSYLMDALGTTKGFQADIVSPLDSVRIDAGAGRVAMIMPTR